MIDREAKNCVSKLSDINNEIIGYIKSMEYPAVHRFQVMQVWMSDAQGESQRGEERVSKLPGQIIGIL